MLKPTILCVDDEPENVDALERLLRDQYKVLKATSGDQALTQLKSQDQDKEPVSVIITDQRMPNMTGSEFLEKSLEVSPASVRILLTGYTDIESVIEAVNKGQIYRYLNKPWDPIDLVLTVNRAHDRFMMQRELARKNAELSSALAELKTLDQAKDQFMILINHELKTPLTSILSYGELLAESSLNDEQGLFVKRIRGASEKLQRIIDDVLLILQVETKTLRMNIKPFSSMELMRRLPDDVMKNLNSKQMKIDSQIVEKKIVGDLALVDQVLTRLVQNAAKFGKNSTTITMTTKLVSPHRCRFEIFNSGSPISEQVIAKVTRPFFLDENIMNHSTGMGLGLTICHSILKAHNSQFSVGNENEGVKASFELPCL